VALRTHRVAGEQVERHDLGRLAAQRGPGVLADQHTGLVVVGGKQRIGGIGRVGGAVERDHHHTLGARLLDGRDDGLGIVGGDQQGLGTGGDHVLHGGHLAGVVAIGLAGAGQQLGPAGLGRGLGAFLHLHEEGVGLGLGDQADHRRRLCGGSAGGQQGSKGERGLGGHVLSPGGFVGAPARPGTEGVKMILRGAPD